MKTVAIIGSGQAGLLAAHALLQQGHKVTLYSERSATQWLHDVRPTGTAARFTLALDYERELGLNHWEAEAPKGTGVHLTFCPKASKSLVTLAGKLEGACFQAIDLRLQCHRWMNDFERLGGTLHVEQVDVARLDAIAQAHDLTLVAAGRGPLAELFPRHPERSVYDRPQRKLLMLIVKGVAMGFEGVPYLPVKFNLFAEYGEAFWVPYYHKDGYACWCLLFEAKTGTKMDRFDDCKTGEELVARAKEVIRDIIPFDYEWCKDMTLTDELGWLKGGVPPTVRQPYAILPSGKAVMPVGDTAISLDPIAGQGANMGNKYVRHTVAAIQSHEGPFDVPWMQANFEAFWKEHGQPTVTFNNMFLEPLNNAGKIILLSQYGSTGDAASPNQKIADAVFANFADPRKITAAFGDTASAKRLVRSVTGRHWLRMLLPSLARVAYNQFRQAVGMLPRHPKSGRSWREA
jgi:hypothetical protein